MAYIWKREDRPERPYYCRIRRKGHPTKTKGFLTRKAAERWARAQEQSLETTGLPLTIDDLLKITVGEIVQKYLDQKTPDKGSSESETSVLERLKQHSICKHSLAAIQRKHAQDWIRERLKDTWKGKPITPRTVAREVNSIRNVFTVAEEEWGYKLPQGNPFSKPKIKGAKHRRKRRLQEGEQERLAEACTQCRGLNKIYVPLAMYLAIETGMRLQEIFNLTWEDIDFQKRTIEIVKSKTDQKQESPGRTIVLPVIAMMYLLELSTALMRKQKRKLKGNLFPMTKDAFEQSWDDVLKRAKIMPDRRGEVLQFRDLRREAGSTFDEAGLTKRENELMLGHLADDTNSIYIASELKPIRDKLDRHVLHGKTLEEFQSKSELEQSVKDGTLQEELERFAKDESVPIEMRRYILRRAIEATPTLKGPLTKGNIIPFAAKAS